MMVMVMILLMMLSLQFSFQPVLFIRESELRGEQIGNLQ